MARIFYSDGSTHDTEAGSPTGELARGVQVIIQPDERLGWTATAPSDYYVLRDDGKWQGTDINGLFDYLMDSGIVLFGRMLNRDQYDAILRQALADRELATKTGFLPRRFKEPRL